MNVVVIFGKPSYLHKLIYSYPRPLMYFSISLNTTFLQRLSIYLSFSLLKKRSFVCAIQNFMGIKAKSKFNMAFWVESWSLSTLLIKLSWNFCNSSMCLLLILIQDSALCKILGLTAASKSLKAGKELPVQLLFDESTSCINSSTFFLFTFTLLSMASVHGCSLLSKCG